MLGRSFRDGRLFIMSYKKDIKEHLTVEDRKQKKTLGHVSAASSAALFGGGALDFLELVSEEILSFAGVGVIGTVGFLAMRCFISAEKDSLGID